MMTNLDPTNSDPNAIAFLTKMQTDWGMDPAQLIDMNDPMTRLVMTMVIANVEQGRDLYSYDQFIKGCAMSAGIDPTTYDSEVNPTTLPIENNTSGAGGYVSVTAPNIQLGSGSLPVLQLSQYIQMGIQMSFNTPGYSGVTSGSVVYGPGGVTGSVTVSSGVSTGSLNLFQAPGGSNSAILQTINQAEGSPAYNLPPQNAGSSASGAYQYIDDTWKAQAAAAGIDVSAYPHEWMAPASVQDAVASANVDAILAKNGNNIAAIPNVWYTGNAQGTMSQKQLDVNNGQTADVYSARWMDKYQKNIASDATSGSVSNPTGLDAGTYNATAYTTDDTGTYRTLTDKNGNDFYQYTDGSIYDSNDKEVKPPDGIPPGFTNVDTQTINGQEVNVYTKEGSNEKYYQNDNTGVITDANGVVQSTTANPNAIQVTELPNSNTGLTSAQQTAYNDVSGLTTAYVENAGKIDTLTAQNNDLSAQNAELQNTYDQNLNATGVPDTSITDKINANQQIIDSNQATVDSLNAQNTDLQTQIQTGTDQYNAATNAAGQTNTIPPAAEPAAGAATGGTPTAAASASSAAAMPSGC